MTDPDTATAIYKLSWEKTRYLNQYRAYIITSRRQGGWVVNKAHLLRAVKMRLQEEKAIRSTLEREFPSLKEGGNLQNGLL